MINAGLKDGKLNLAGRGNDAAELKKLNKLKVDFSGAKVNRKNGRKEHVVVLVEDNDESVEVEKLKNQLGVVGVEAEKLKNQLRVVGVEVEKLKNQLRDVKKQLSVTEKELKDLKNKPAPKPKKVEPKTDPVDDKD
jgi:chromosome segregation ATPase